jgi:hypothetical protein
MFFIFQNKDSIKKRATGHLGSKSIIRLALNLLHTIECCQYIVNWSSIILIVSSIVLPIWLHHVKEMVCHWVKQPVSWTLVAGWCTASCCVESKRFAFLIEVIGGDDTRPWAHEGAQQRTRPPPLRLKSSATTSRYRGARSRGRVADLVVGSCLQQGISAESRRNGRGWRNETCKSTFNR